VGSVEDDFRGTVPTGDDVFSKSFLNLFLFVTSSKTKITDLELTTFIKENIARLQISVNNIGRV